MPAPKKTPLDQLKDLSPDERDQLRRALDGEVIQVDAEQRATHRLRLFADLMDPRDHLRNCPTVGELTPRIEAFGATAAADPAARLPQRPVTVVRCIECAGQVKLEEAYANVSRRINSQIAALSPERAS